VSKRLRVVIAAGVVVAAAVATILVVSELHGAPARTALGLSRFQEDLQAGRVKTATLYDRDHEVKGTLSDGTRYVVRVPDQYTGSLTGDVVKAGVDLRVEVQHSSPWGTLLTSVIPLVLILGLVVFALVRLQGGPRMFSFGRSRAKAVHKDMPKVRFEDVAGLDEAVDELREVRDFLAEPKRFEQLGARIPKGVLLYGPPGTGKTLLARAVAGEAGVPFFSISGSDFVEMFVGVGAARVRDLFARAKATPPAIVFVDEIDAVGRQRGSGVGGGHDEREQTLNQLLVELDGFDTTSGVILIAATNRPDVLDPALLRPGRFDRQIVVDRPDLEGRKAILRVHGRDKPLASGVDLDVVARRTPGFTGADLANVVNEAALLSARRGFEVIGNPQFDEAIERVIAGPERRGRVISEHEQRVIAFHESGHALVAHALPTRPPVHKISIIPRGRALGYTLVLPSEDRLLATRQELRDEMAMLLGGRTAEELTFADPTTGAHDDIERATTIGRRMVTEFGMSDVVGLMRVGRRERGDAFAGRDRGQGQDYSEEVAARVDAEVRTLLDTAHDVARNILVENRAALDRLAVELLDRETLEAADVERLLADVPAWHDVAGRRPSAVAASEPPAASGSSLAGGPIS
jgi:cell division protease FtsH